MSTQLTQSYQRLNESEYYASGIRSKLRIYAKYNKYSQTQNQDIANNKTNVTLQLRTYALSGSFFSSGNSSGLDCTGNRGTQYYDIGTVNQNEKVIGTWTFDLYHKADGTYSGSASAWADVFAGVVPSISCEFSLPTIPRVSDIACTSCSVGDTAMIVIARKSNAFKDTITYKIGTLTGTLATKTSDQIITFDTSIKTDDIYEQMGPANKNIDCEITVQTYNDNTLIGDKKIKISLNAKESDCVPEISATIVDSNQKTIALTGDNNKIIRGYSDAKITYTITPKHNATIISKTINGSELKESPFVIEKTDTSSFLIVATDSRGFSIVLTINKNLVDYAPLSISFNAFRPTPTGSEIRINFVGTYFNENFGLISNTLKLSWKYRKKNEISWTNGGTFNLNTDYKILGNTFYSGVGTSTSDITLNDSLFPYDKIYEIAIFCEDKMLSFETVKTVPKGKPVLNWEENGVYLNVPGYLESGNEILDYDIIDEW